MTKYDATSIQVLEGLDAVRKRPGMYIGSTDARGLHHLVWEIVDNAIDEALIGVCNHIKVTIHNDNSIEIEDNGRGIPVDEHATGIPATEVIFTQLHAGGKFGGSSYKMSGGLHGVGASVVNALSEWLKVTVHLNGKKYRQEFADGGSKITKLKVIGEVGKRTTGSIIWFKPDPKYFSSTLYNFETIAERLRQSAFLVKGLRIDLHDKRSGSKDTFEFKDGIVEFVSFLNDKKKAYHNPVYFSHDGDIEIEVALQYTKSYSDHLVSFVNNVRTKDGGTHETGFKTGLTKIFNEHARRIGLIKEKEDNLEGVDIREGLTAILSVRVPENLLQFEGQTKSKLGTPEARTAVDTMIFDNMKYFLEENADLSNKLISKCINARKARNAARQARENARLQKKHKKNDVILSGKLSPAQSKDPNQNELFLVEGDSAGGSAKQGRNRKFQAILPLRGKVINTERAKVTDVLKNEEIGTIINTIGAGFGTDFKLDDVKYNKIIIMTDADTDGAHIQVLLLTFFFRYMPQLIKAGKIYIAQPPLYKITFSSGKDKIQYAWTNDELEELTEGKKYNIQRFKGLGEMNADQLWDTTMNPDSRTLIQVSIDDESDAEQRIATLMGDNVEHRREWIEENISFANEDDFLIDTGE